MRVKLLSGIAISVLAVALSDGFAGSARAADLAVKAPPAPYVPAWSWTGLYLGFHVGAEAGEAKFSDPLGPPIFGDKVRTPGFLGGGQIGYNWQLPSTPWVFGIESDISAMDSEGTNTCMAASGFIISQNCRVRLDATGTITGRIGIAGGPDGHTLYYVKGGAAWLNEKVDMAVNAILPPEVSSATFTKWGGTVGAGVEHALTPAWSLKLEYDYLTFGGSGMATAPAWTQITSPVNLFNITSASTSVSQNSHEVKIGLNYKFGADPWASWPGSAAYPVKAAPVYAPGWEFDAGGRYWYSFGRFQKDLGSTTSASTANVLNSRLTYENTAHSGEFFGRIETPWNWFVKGFVGAGGLAGGHMNDEDWAICLNIGCTAVQPYSNTISDPVKGSIAYGTIDLGYDFFRGPGYKFGGFVGYNYYKENKDAYGCVQIANNVGGICAPPIPSSTLVITENDTWNSLRVGVSGETMIWDRLKLSGDVAYIPYLNFTGTDVHWLRTDVPNKTSPESGNGGHGVQLEAILSYYVTPGFSVGVGGRYWAMWTNQSASTNIFGTPCPCQTLPSKAERVGAFLQADYKF